MSIHAIHVATIHGNHAAVERLLREAQGILADDDAPEPRKQFASSFIRSNRRAFHVVSERDDGPEAA